jgi:hypothetical protein
MDKKPKVDPLESARYILELTKLAVKYEGNNKNGGDQLASALIYANLAEYFAYSLLKNVYFQINRNLSNLDYKITSLDLSKTNLEGVIRLLERFDFPKKGTIMPLLTKIKDQRNKLFHGLVYSKENGVKPYTFIKNIQKDTKKLMTYWGEVISSVK